MINKANCNSLTASLMVEELTRLGVSQFCISPGSRSTPLALAVAENENASATIHYDERGAAFYALGQAKASGKPSVLICTSGTAAANYYPAVIEAAMTSTPMIILSADRPERLQGTGANQTIDQIELFGRYPRLFANLVAEQLIDKPSRLLSAVDKAYQLTISPDPGPVHLNCMFDEPLAPIEDGNDYAEPISGIDGWLESGQPLTEIEADAAVSEEDLVEVAERLTRSKKGLVVVGGLPTYRSHEHIVKLANNLGWPTLCDITSGLRFSGAIDTAVPFYDQYLLADTDAQPLRADTVLHLGGSLLSKRLQNWLDHKRPKEYIQVKQGKLPFDPNHQVTLRINADQEMFAALLDRQLGPNQQRNNYDPVLAFSTRFEQQLDELLTHRAPLTEANASRLISRELPKGHALFLASSLTIRQFDMYGVSQRAATAVGSNRGASGIDGTLASAVGFADQLKCPLTVVLGDLAMLHDLNSLYLVKQASQPITVVILNNNGGRIFEQLPVANFKNHFEELFITPTRLGFEYGAQMFGLNYFHCESMAQFRERYRIVTSFPRSTILELRIIPEMSRASRERLVLAGTKALKDASG